MIYILLLFLQNSDITEQTTDNVQDSIQLWHDIEYVIIGIVIAYQIYHTITVISQITVLKNIFSRNLFIKNAFIEKEKIGEISIHDANDIHFEDDIDLDEKSIIDISNDKVIKLSLVETNGKSHIIKSIRDGINTYLINNYGAAVNFSIIKDIIDREIDVIDNEVNQAISLPLYLGIAATIIGIIFGLFSMPTLNFEVSSATDRNSFELAINALINGVKIAMIASFFGIFWTTFLSSFLYKPAKRKLQKEKNNQITYLQAKLLPELLKAEDTGVSGLKASLDKFARVATGMTDNIFQSVIKSEENLKLQNRLIAKVQKMNVNKISKYNIELFDKMDENMESFKDFSTYLVSLKQMTSQLYDFSNRTSDIDKVLKNIDSSLIQSNELTKFLSSHFQKIENSGDSALKAVGIAETHFEKAILSLNKRTENMLEKLYQSSGDHEVKLEKIYSDINKNLNQISTEYINQLKKVFDDSTLNFEKLENLEYISQINSSLTKIETNKLLLDKLSSIENKLVNHSVDQSVLTKLDSLDSEVKKTGRAIENVSNSIKNKSNQDKQPTSKPFEVKPNKTSKNKEKISLSKVFKKVFKK